MSYNPPSLEDLREQFFSKLSGKLSQTIPLLPKSFIWILSVVLAGAVSLCYKTLGWVFLQMFPSKASYETTTFLGREINPLIEWGRSLNVGDPEPATACEVTAEFAMLAGGTVPAGTLARGKNGLVFRSTMSVLATVSPVEIPFICTETGTSGNLFEGDEINLVNPSAVIDTSGEVSAVTVTAADMESEENYRQRVVDALQKPPRGSAYSDFEKWAEEPAGIRAAYPYDSELVDGQVDIFVQSVTGIPTPAELDAVIDSLYLPDRRQANTVYNVLPVFYQDFQVEVNGLEVVQVADCQAAIEAALEEFFDSRAPYIGGLSVPPREDIISHSAVVGVIASVAEAYDGVFAGAVVTSEGSSVQVTSLVKGQLAQLTAVTFP